MPVKKLQETSDSEFDVVSDDDMEVDSVKTKPTKQKSKRKRKRSEKTEQKSKRVKKEKKEKEVKKEKVKQEKEVKKEKVKQEKKLKKEDKKKRKKVEKSPLEQKDYSVLEKKNLIKLFARRYPKSVLIPSYMSTDLKKIVSHTSECPKASLSELENLFNVSDKMNKADFMCRCLAFYQRQWPGLLKFLKKESVLISRGALCGTKQKSYDDLSKIYEDKLCGMEEKHHRFSEWLATEQDPSEDMSDLIRITDKPKKAKMGENRPWSSYNSYIRDEWKKGQEALTKEIPSHVQGTTNTIKIIKWLAIKWKEDPELKKKYDKICEDEKKLKH